MNVDSLLAAMTPETYTNLKQAVETGKWPDGRALNENQKAVCLQAVMLYQAKVEQSNQHMTVDNNGEIIHKSKSELRQELKNEEPIARFKQDDI